MRVESALCIVPSPGACTQCAKHRVPSSYSHFTVHTLSRIHLHPPPPQSITSLGHLPYAPHPQHPQHPLHLGRLQSTTAHLATLLHLSGPFSPSCHCCSTAVLFVFSWSWWVPLCVSVLTATRVPPSSCQVSVPLSTGVRPSITQSLSFERPPPRGYTSTLQRRETLPRQKQSQLSTHTSQLQSTPFSSPAVLTSPLFFVEPSRQSLFTVSLSYNGKHSPKPGPRS